MKSEEKLPNFANNDENEIDEYWQSGEGKDLNWATPIISYASSESESEDDSEQESEDDEVDEDDQDENTDGYVDEQDYNDDDEHYGEKPSSRVSRKLEAALSEGRHRDDSEGDHSMGQSTDSEVGEWN